MFGCKKTELCNVLKFDKQTKGVGMFSSGIITGILTTQVEVSGNRNFARFLAGYFYRVTHNIVVVFADRRAYASMTAEKSTDSQDGGAAEAGTEHPWRDDSIHHSPTHQNVDVEALSMLYEQFRRPIHSYVYRLLGNTDDADDVTQEVFVRACLAWDGLYERDNLSAWLYRIATNLCVDLMRRRKRISWRSLVPRSNSDGPLEGVQGEDSSVLLTDSGGIPEIAERDHIRLALANMPEEYAVALILNAAQGIPYQEVAAITGISPNAAATRISRAKRMFADQYRRLSIEGVGKQGKAR
jgi:RNA polymerase sigma-70 factor, ECF subfamily